MEELDRLSESPDEILHRILSSTGPNQAVQTSILSKRWRNLWSSLPVLNFKEIDALPSFEHFVIQFLSHRDQSSPVREFGLDSSSIIDSVLMEKWIEYALNHGVECLHIHVRGYSSNYTPFIFPKDFLAIRTLRVLCVSQRPGLGNSECFAVPRPFVLPSLKTLTLTFFRFNDDSDDLYSLPKEPFSGFLDLEELTLVSCDVSNLIISAPELKSLSIHFDHHQYLEETKMERISAPKLISFSQPGVVQVVCPEIDAPCLEEVYFHVFPHFDSSIETDGVSLVRMMRQFKIARFVTIAFQTIDLLEQLLLEMGPSLFELHPSPFTNIKCLNIEVDSSYEDLTVSQDVVNYLTKGSSHGDSVVVNYVKNIIRIIYHFHCL